MPAWATIRAPRARLPGTVLVCVCALGPTSWHPIAMDSNKYPNRVLMQGLCVCTGGERAARKPASAHCLASSPGRIQGPIPLGEPIRKVSCRACPALAMSRHDQRGCTLWLRDQSGSRLGAHCGRIFTSSTIWVQVSPGRNDDRAGGQPFDVLVHTDYKVR